MSKKKPYRVAQAWGEGPTVVTQHEFKTLAEVTAYWQGVEDADGWAERNCVEDVLQDDFAIKNLANNQGQSLRTTRKQLKDIVKWLEEAN